MKKGILGKMYAWEVKKYPDILDAIKADVDSFTTQLGYPPQKIAIYRHVLPEKLPKWFPEPTFLTKGQPTRYWMLYPVMKREPRILLKERVPCLAER